MSRYCYRPPPLLPRCLCTTSHHAFLIEAYSSTVYRSFVSFRPLKNLARLADGPFLYAGWQGQGICVVLSAIAVLVTRLKLSPRKFHRSKQMPYNARCVMFGLCILTPTHWLVSIKAAERKCCQPRLLPFRPFEAHAHWNYFYGRVTSTANVA